MASLIIYLVFILTAVFFSYISIYKMPVKMNEQGICYYQSRRFWVFACAVIMILFYAFRGLTGTDTVNYIELFKYSEFVNYSIHTRDCIFWWINDIDYYIFSGNVVLHNIVIGCIAYIPILYVYCKYTERYDLAIILYIFIAYFLAFNGQRQQCAVAFCILGYMFFARKEYFKYLLCMVIAYGFHTTSIIMIPVMLLASRRTDSKLFIGIITAVVILSLNIKLIWNWIINLMFILRMDVLAVRYADALDTMGKGHIINALIYIPPIILGIVYYKKLNMKNIPKLIKAHGGSVLSEISDNKTTNFNLILNLNIISCLFNLMGTNMVYFNRLSYYFSPLLPILVIRVGSALKKNDRIVYYFFVILLYGLIFLRGLYHSGHLMPYDLQNGIKMFYGLD